MAGIGDNLAGIMGIMQRNKALRQDRREWEDGAEGREAAVQSTLLANQTAESELDSDEAFGQLNSLQDQGVLDAGFNVSPDILDTIESGNDELTNTNFTRGFSTLATAGMRKQNQLDDNQIISGYSKTSDGQYILEIEYTDGPLAGTVAPLTQNGTSDDGDPVQPLSRDQVLAFMGEGATKIENDAGAEQGVANNANQTIVDSTYGAEKAIRDNVANINAALNEKSGGKAASRAFMSSVHGMELSEQQAQIESVAADLGIELIPMPAPQELTPPDIAVAGQPAAPQRSGGPLAIAGRQEQTGRAQREESRIAALPGRLQEAKERLADLESRGLPDKHPSLVQNRKLVADIESELAAMGSDAPATAQASKGNPAVDYMATQRKITDTLETMTPDQVASGNFSFITPEDRAATIGMLRERQIASSRDIKQLPPKEQAMAWATLAAYAPTEGARTAAITNLRNITETGVASVSQKDLLGTGSDNDGDYFNRNQVDTKIVGARDMATDEDGNLDTSAYMERLNQVKLGAKPGSGGANAINTEIANVIRETLTESVNTSEGWWDGFVKLFTPDALNDTSSIDFSGFKKVVNPNTGDIESIQFFGPDGKKKGSDVDISDVRRRLGTSEGFNAVLERMPTVDNP